MRRTAISVFLLGVSSSLSLSCAASGRGSRSPPSDSRARTQATRITATTSATAGLGRAGSLLVYAERAPANGAEYTLVASGIIRGIVADRGPENVWLVFCPNNTDQPLEVYHGTTLAREVRFLPDDFTNRSSVVRAEEFETGLSRGLELTGQDADVIIFSAGTALADFPDSAQGLISRTSKVRTVDVVSFGAPPGDFRPLVSGYVITIEDGSAGAGQVAR